MRRLTLQHLLFLLLVHTLAISAHAATDHVRLAWTDDPATTMTVGWRQLSGTATEVKYRVKGSLSAWNSESGIISRSFQNTSNGASDVMENRFVTLSGLQAHTDYEFEVCDSDGCSAQYRWFRTAPDTPQPISFVAGGDSRRESSADFGDNDQARVNGFKLVARLRPLFVLFSGDFMNDGTFEEWLNWLDEWALTQSSDGRMYPILPTHGNHENDELDMMRDIFNVAGPSGNSAFGTYNALSIGGNMLRIWTLNTELEPGVGYGAYTGQSSVAWNEQTAWLSSDMAAHAGVTWKLANYHRPLRPHTAGKSEGLLRYSDWAPLFDSYDLDLAIESDSHMVKYTKPVNMASGAGSDEGFLAADYLSGEHGTVFIGEGSWGAPKRPIDDDKSWTLVSNSFWQFKHIQVDASQMHIRTVRFENGSYPNGVELDVMALTQADQDADPYALPLGLDLWQPFEGDGPLTLPLTAEPAVKADANVVPDAGDAGGAPDGALFWNDFSGGFTSTEYGDITTYDLGCDDSSSDDWYVFNGQKASINGYFPSAADVNENCDDWMILPPQDLSTRTAITLTFDSDYNYSGPALKLWVSSDYNPAVNASPASASWTELSFDLPSEGGYAAASSGPVVIAADDFPVAERSSVYLALQYTSNGRGPGDGRIWEVDNIAIVEGVVSAPAATTETFDDGTLGYWQGVSVSSSYAWSPASVAGRAAASMYNQFAFSQADDWLVSPAFALAADGSNARFNFAYYYAGATAQNPASDNFQLLLKPACSLNGSYTSSDLNASEWTLLEDTYSGTEGIWNTHPEIDLSAYAGQNVCLAFRYRDGGAATARRWAVDDLVLGDLVVTVPDPIPAKTAGDLRVASFNTLLADRGAGQLASALATPNDAQAQGIAEIIQLTAPDIVLLNEFDFDASENTINDFKSHYLQVSQNGAPAITYPYHYVARVNTGVQPESEGDPDCDFNDAARGCSSVDESGNGYDDPEDAYGFGNYGGVYGMALLSKYPLDTANIRTFRKFLWKDMPGNLMPTAFYHPAEQQIFRLSSKSHWDIPVNVDGEIVHVLASHPTPPVFDGPEDRNGRRNHDEIRFWEDYVSLTGSDCYIYDDAGQTACLGYGRRFVLMGDQNADPVNGDSFANAILQVLNNPAVDNSFQQRSSGGSGTTSGETATADFGIRADYALASTAGLNITMSACDPEDPALSCGVFWPRSGDPLRRLTGSCASSGSACASSDHRLVWLDVQVVPDSDGDAVPDDVDNCQYAADSAQSDLDRDGSGDVCDPDDDGDGMDDTWEVQYGLNPLDPADAAQDADGDGKSNLYEFQNGRNPVVDEFAHYRHDEDIPLPLWAYALLSAFFAWKGYGLKKGRAKS